MRDTSEYLVSAIVSVYKAEEFIAGCLEDLLSQTIAERIEIIVVDSASPGGEGDIVREFQKSHRNIRLVRTARRETIYAAWNRGIAISTAPFLTNANADDRHRKDALERLVRELEDHPEAALAYGGYRETTRKNDSFDSGLSGKEVIPPDFSRDKLLLNCFVGPQPVWRRSLHDEFGLFDSRFQISGDYEFWLRVSERYRFIRVPESLGLYYVSPEYANASIRDLPRNREETARVVDRYFRRHLSRMDPKISFVLPDVDSSVRWGEWFSDATERIPWEWDAVVVTEAPGRIETDWEATGNIGRFGICRTLSEEVLRALTGEYVILLLPVGKCPLEEMGIVLSEIQERGYRAGVPAGSLGGKTTPFFLVLRKDTTLEPTTVTWMNRLIAEGAKNIPRSEKFELLSVDRPGWHPLRGRFSRELRLAELDALEYVWRKGWKSRSLSSLFFRSAGRFFKERYLRKKTDVGRSGRLESAVKGWTEFLKGAYGEGFRNHWNRYPIKKVKD